MENSGMKQKILCLVTDKRLFQFYFWVQVQTSLLPKHTKCKPDDSIDLIHDVSQLEVSVSRRQLQFQHETVYFVDTQSYCQPLL